MALQYANSGLEVSPKDPQLLTAKAIALVKLHRLPEAVAAYKDLLAAQPDNAKIVCDLAELLLITGQVEEYQALLAKHKSQIDTAYDGVLTKYFSVLEAYQTKNQDEFREVVIQTVAAFPSTTGPVLRGWDFDELLAVISKKSDYRKKSVLTTFVDVLAGKVSRENALKTIKEK
jgi:tetratricopeptide (TPR) repeat protein